jgi:hypothetical protein
MNTKFGNLMWGLILIAAGGFLLAERLGYIGALTPRVWAGIFGATSLLFLIVYLAQGVGRWGWLFPACIFAGVAATVYLSTVTSGSILGVPVLLGVAAPFAAAFSLDRQRNKWALIPGGIMLLLTLTTFLADRVQGAWIGSLVMFAIAIGFLVAYLYGARWWALLVAYILGLVGLMPLLATTARPELIGVLVQFGIALPFFVVYFRSPARWWAVIPAGILSTVGVMLLVVLGPGIPGENYNTALPTAIIFAGVAATFAVVWLRHAQRWAMWASGLSALASAAVLFTGSRFQEYWPVVLIAIGAILLFNTFRPRQV